MYQIDPHSLQIWLFGAGEARTGGAPLPPLRYRKDFWVLALLALSAGKEVARERLATTLWPDAEESQGLYYLRRSLTNLRRALGSEAGRIVSPTAHTLQLTSDGAFVDVAAFDAALGRDAGWNPDRLAGSDEDALARAIALYRGPLLRDCAADWTVPERAMREQAYFAALEALAARLAARGAHAEATRPLRLLVSADPYRESACAALMRSLSECGDRAAMGVVYQALRRTLRADLNKDPAPETQELHRRLTHHLLARPPAPPPAAGTLPPAALPNRRPDVRRLPVPLSDLIGREADIAEVAGWLGRCRLVTLQGPGGVGKTRLAIAAAEASLPKFPDGVWFVDLAPVADPAGVADAACRALALPDEPGRAAGERLADALTPCVLLLVLDNCEHLSDACASLAADLLAFCPDLRVLTTSRQPLGLPGEQCWAVPPLELPPPDVARPPTALDTLRARGEKDPASVLEYASVRLFVERARQSDLSFRLTRRSAPAVAEICRLLDGMPLALEMAAARARSLSAPEILARMDDRFRLLTVSAKSVVPRQQTLRATLDWSFDLLSPDERAVLSRLSVFAGGWTAGAAERVCAGDGVSAEDIQELLAQLVDKNLVVRELSEDLGSRFRLLETVRQYAADRLQESGQADAARERHRQEIERLIGSGNPQLLPDTAGWLRRVDADRDNVLAALAWSLTLAPGGEAAAVRAARMAKTLWLYWNTRALYREGRAFLLAALDASPAAREHPECNPCLVLAALFDSHEGHGVNACGLIEERIRWCEVHGDDDGLIHALMNLHVVIRAMGDRVAATATAERSLAEIERAAAAGTVESERLRMFRRAVRGNLARDPVCESGYEAAVRLMRENLAEGREYDPPDWRVSELLNLGFVLLGPWQGRDVDAAEADLREGLLLASDLGSQADLVFGVFSLALAARQREQWTRAGRLLGASRGLAQPGEGVLADDPWGPEGGACLEAVCAALGPEMSDVALAEGEAMTPEQALAYALAPS